MKRSVTVVLPAVTVSLLAVLIAYRWALDPLGDHPIAIITGRETGVDLVRQFFPFRVVPPEWIAARADSFQTFYVWSQIESVARLGLVAVVWCVALTFILLRDRREESANTH